MFFGYSVQRSPAQPSPAQFCDCITHHTQPLVVSVSSSDIIRIPHFPNRSPHLFHTPKPKTVRNVRNVRTGYIATTTVVGDVDVSSSDIILIPHFPNRSPHSAHTPKPKTVRNTTNVRTGYITTTATAAARCAVRWLLALRCALAWW